MKKKKEISKTRKRVNIILKILCAIIIVVSICYFALLKVAREKYSIMSQEDFYIVIEQENLNDISRSWINSYLDQYTKFWIYKEQRIQEFNIKEIEDVDVNEKIIRAEIDMKKCSDKMNYFEDWYNVFDKEELRNSKDIKCDILMYFEIKEVDNEKRLYLKNINPSTDFYLNLIKNNEN